MKHAPQPHYRIHAPGLGRVELQPPAAFAAAVWLAMQAPKVKELPLFALEQLILQPQATHNEVLILSQQNDQDWQPRVWMSYAQMSAQDERNYVRNPAHPIPPQAWNSGDRLWMLHLIAHPTFNHDLHRLLRDLFAQRSARSLSPDSHRTGQRIVIWRGTQCSPADAQQHWLNRPILA